MLETLIDIDYTDAIDRIPRKHGFRTLPLRGREDAITLHYSGVAYDDRFEAAELRHILNEARYHITKNWGEGDKPIYADGYMYDFVVLSNGKIVRTRRIRRQIYHAGNHQANEGSWSVHVLLGKAQDLTPNQRVSLFRLFDALRAQSNIPRNRVLGHNEWPRTSGDPRPSAIYRILPRQSECPGPILHRHLADYRAIADAPPAPAPPPIDLGNYTIDSPILGPAHSPADIWIEMLSARSAEAGYSRHDVGVIVGEYRELGTLLGVDWFLALCQLAHETGRLTSWWCQRPRRNPAGLGVTGAIIPAYPNRPAPPARAWFFDGSLYREGLSFTAWRDRDASDGEGSISHHLGRLLAYALPSGAGSELQQRYINRALGLRWLPPTYRGSAPTLLGLNGRWAYPGRTYAQMLARYANIVRKAAYAHG